MTILGTLRALFGALSAFFGLKRDRNLMDAGAAEARAEGQDGLLEKMGEDRARDAVIESDPSERYRLLREFGGPKK